MKIDKEKKEDLLLAARVALRTPESVEFWQGVAEQLDKQERGREKAKTVVQPRELRH